MKFYSKEEIATLKATVKSGEKLTRASERLSKEFKRSKGSIYFKLLEIAREMGVRKKRVRKAANVVKPIEEGVTLRNGFVFDFKPQRAEMYKDHVRIYF